MTKRIKETVKTGKWLYDGTVPSEVWIIRQNYFEGSQTTDEEPVPGYPPIDHDGMFYYAAYTQQGTVRGVSNLYGSVQEAMQIAERTIQGRITWD